MELLILLTITLVVTSLAVLFCWIRAKRKKKWVSNDPVLAEEVYIGDLSADDLFYISSPIKYKPNFTV